ncbi:hypothetical protein Y032_0050g2003 [Ancylostoma ceylanicum]|uniref:Uncharacterized protein n=1 Tax=Ancylostoma ceylanicum TaxID=53326 RepID=A0A016UAL5_9BILA|nr:hypothetical protein Y032_0050g2003 [Ancylostoma ceylanicum]
MTQVDTSYTFSAPMAFIYPTLAQKTCPFLPSPAHTFEDHSRAARMNRPITAQQRTFCHVADDAGDEAGRFHLVSMI